MHLMRIYFSILFFFQRKLKIFLGKTIIYLFLEFDCVHNNILENIFGHLTWMENKHKIHNTNI